MSLRGTLRGSILSRGVAGGGGSSAPAPDNPPSILSFTLDDMTLDTGVPGTFSWTKSGTQTAAVLDPGDGSGNYTLTTESSQAHTYDAEGVYDATLTLTGPGGTSSPATIPDIVVSAAGGSTDFQQITTMKSDTSGAHMAHAVGVPAQRGVVSAARSTKLVARYPNTEGGTLYPCQTDNVKSWTADSSMQHAAIHVKLPVGYVAGEKVGIGYSDTHSFPSAPNWSTVTSSYAADFNAKLSVYDQCVALLATTGMPVCGDQVVIEFTDSIGTQTFTFDCDTSWYGENALGYPHRVVHNLSRFITQDPASRYRTWHETLSRPLPFNRATNDPREPSAVWLSEGYSSNLTRVTQNVPLGDILGGVANAGPFYVNGVPARYLPTPNTTGFAMLIRRKWESGNPDNFTATCAFNATGRTLRKATTTTAFTGGWVLPISSRSGSWVAGQIITGSNGAKCEIMKVVSTSVVIVDYIDKTVSAISNGVTLTTSGGGTATATGALTRNKATGASSGATFDIIYGADGTYLRGNNPVGTFTTGETITAPCGGSGTVHADGVSAARTNWLFQEDPAPAAAVASGDLPILQAATSRVDWTMTWSDGTDIPGVIGTWFGADTASNHQVLQKVRTVPVRDPSNNIHPDLVGRMTVSWDRDGNIIYARCAVENPHMHNFSRDRFYDCTEINLNGVNQISGDLDNYKDKVHIPWAKWGWEWQDAEAICDGTHFMQALLVPTWRRRDHAAGKLSGFRVVTRGHDYRKDDPHGFSDADITAGNTPRLGYAKDRAGVPLYPGPIKFDPLGGASPTISVDSYWDWLFWSHDDPFEIWNDLKQLADNCWGAYPLYPRDEDPATGHEDAPPHLYLRWYLQTEGQHASTPTGHKIKLCTRFPYAHGSSASPPGSRDWSFGYMRTDGFTAAQSHAPPQPARSPYLVRPLSHFVDSLEGYGWIHSTTRGNSLTYPVPKTGGVAGDPDHKLLADPGNRPFAWPWRSRTWAASVMFDRHPRRDHWRRAASDGAEHVALNIAATWKGYYHGRGIKDSNTWSVGSMQAGEPYRRLTLSTDEQVTGAASAWAHPGSPYLDLFKSGYVVFTAIRGVDMDAYDYDLSTAFNTHVGPIEQVEHLKDESYWGYFIGNTCMYVCFLDQRFNDYDNRVDDPIVWTQTNFKDIYSIYNTMTTTILNDHAGTRNPGTYTTTPQPDFTGGENPVGPQNYNRIRFHVSVLQGLARHMTDSAKATRADAMVTWIESKFPHSSVDTLYQFPSGLTFDDWWGPWGALRPTQTQPEWS